MANLMDMLGSQASKTAKTVKKKDEMPTLNLEDNDKNRRIVDNWVKFKRDEVTAVNNKKKEEESLKTLIIEARTKFCMESKSFHKSVKIKVGEDTPLRKSEFLTASFQDKVSKIDLKGKDQLQEIFGEDYSKFFKLSTNIQLTDTAMGQVEKDSAAGKPTVLDKLIEALGGPEKFFELFEVSQEIEPRSCFFEACVTDPVVNGKVKKAEGLVKIQNPSLLL